jgi:hypothetical protein
MDFPEIENFMVELMGTDCAPTVHAVLVSTAFSEKLTALTA